MHVEIHPWEHALLSLAYEAHHADADYDKLSVEDALLESAYAYCDALTAANSRSFHLASALLPAGKRRAVRALYAFCRVTDDLVDRADGSGGQAALEAWRQRLAMAHPPVDDLVALAWADARQRFSVPGRFAEQLVDGVARDLRQQRYATFEELAEYSYGVASTVGLMSMHIIGYRGATAIPYAIKLGVALQLTNILRDIAEDWRLGRLYLPQNELAEFGLSDADIAAGAVTPRWREFMQFQIERNRRLYAEAWPGIAMLNRDGRFAIAAAAELYRGILLDIERHDYDVFNRRAYVSTTAKLAMLPAIWWKIRRA